MNLRLGWDNGVYLTVSPVQKRANPVLHALLAISVKLRRNEHWAYLYLFQTCFRFRVTCADNRIVYYGSIGCPPGDREDNPW